MKWLAHIFVRMLGWRFEGNLPDNPKLVVIGAPHTTNWDFVLFLAALHHWDISVRFLAKDGLFKWPFNYFFSALGGIPVDRKQAGGVVFQVLTAFEEADSMILAIAPEGTRSKAQHWRSGFLKIAESAGVPIVVVGIDGPSRMVTMGPALEVGDNLEELMDEIREFFEDKRGWRPDRRSPVTLREGQD